MIHILFSNLFIFGTNKFILHNTIIVDIIDTINTLNIGYTMIKKEPVMTLRKNLGQILNEVEYKHDTVIITRAGKSSAAIIDMKLFEKIRRMKDKFQRLTTELQDSFSNTQKQEKDTLINEALTAARKK